MDKKYSDAFEAFEKCQFEDCLRQVDQILKKMEKPDAKKKNHLPQKDMNNLQMIRAGSLSAIGDIHQSNALMKAHFPEPPISEDQSFLFLQICSMAMDRRLFAFANAIQGGKEKQKIDISRFLLLSKNFQALSRAFLRQYMAEKKHESAIAQIYLEYLKQVEPHDPIRYSRNPTIKQCPLINLKMVSMFLNKFLASFKLNETFQNKAQELSRHKKIKKSVADLLLKIAFHQQKPQTVRECFTQWYDSLGLNKFTYLRSMLRLSEEKQENLLLWTKTYLSIFKFNMELDQYEPVYDFSLEFIQDFQSQHKINFSCLKEPTKVELKDCYLYVPSSPAQQFQNYYDSLLSEYLMLEGNENFTKDFYRISLKNVLLLLLFISSESKHDDLARKFLLDYKEHFGKTLTFCSEIYHYTLNQKLFPKQFLQQKMRPACQKWSKPDDKLIWMINEERMFPNEIRKGCFQEWERLLSLYETNIEQVQKIRPLEKGERYLSDQFLTILADSVRKQVENTAELSNEELQDRFFFMLGILEKGIERSPYNSDLKLRAIYFLDKLGYYQQIIQMLDGMDIKAVQFDTLGFFYLKQIINYSLFETNETLIVRMVRGFQENYRESSEYAYKALKAGCINECYQNLSYHSHMERSYNWCMVLYTLFLKNRGKAGSDFYLQEIIHKLDNSQGVTFNCDFRVMRNVLDWNGEDFVDFYGIFNSQKILRNQCLLRLIIQGISCKRSMEENFENLKTVRSDWALKDLYTFTSYQFFERQPKYVFDEGIRHHQRQNKIMLDLYNKIVEVKLIVINYCQALAENTDFKSIYESGVEKIKETRGYILSHPWRCQIKLLHFIRQHYVELIELLAAQNEAFSGKNKKKVEGKELKRETCGNLIDALISSVSDEAQLEQGQQREGKWKSESMRQRDEILRRMTVMSSQELKKMYKIKL